MRRVLIALQTVATVGVILAVVGLIPAAVAVFGASIVIVTYVVLCGGEAKLAFPEARPADPKVEFKPTAHPAWEAAILAARERRLGYVNHYADLSARIALLRQGRLNWPKCQDRAARLDSEMRKIEQLMARTFGELPIRLRDFTVDVDALRSAAALDPPRGEVLRLDRGFALTTDCRYGHWGQHSIESSDGDRLTRCCAFCEPHTRWTERI